MIKTLGFCFLSCLTLLANAQDCHFTEGWNSMEFGWIGLDSEEGVRVLEVRVANDNSERAAGYQWICEHDAKESAVLFVFPRQISSAFHMRNVWVPLDIYFFDESGAQVDAMVMRPEPPGSGHPQRLYQPSGAFQYALEIVRDPNQDLMSTPPPLRLVPVPTSSN